MRKWADVLNKSKCIKWAVLIGDKHVLEPISAPQKYTKLLSQPTTMSHQRVSINTYQ